LADFADATGEGLGNSVTSLLRADLLDASFLDLVEQADIAATLTLMRVEAGAPLTSDMALEAAAREGIAAIIDGEVASAGSGYIITAALRSTESARAIASFRATAEGPDAVIPAMVQLSEDIRSKSGESLRTIRAGDPLEKATTSSLDALRLYTEAEAARNAGDGQHAIELLEQALARDSTFAMAWRLLFITSQDDNAAIKAFQLRERLPDLERYVVEGLYYSVIAGDRASSVAAYERALDIDPSELRALNNLAGHLVFLGDLDGARDLLIRAIEGGRSTALPRLTLRKVLIDLGSFDQAFSRFPGLQDPTPDSDLRGFEFDLVFAKGEISTAANFVGDRSDGPAQLTNVRDATNRLRLALWTGRLDEARSLNLRLEELGSPGNWARRINTALSDILVGDPDWGRRHLTEAPFEDRPPPWASLSLAFSADPDAAQSLLDYWTTTYSAEERAKPNVAINLDRWAIFVRVARGDTVGAVAAFQRVTAAAACADSCWPSHEARLHDDLGHHDQAIALHERMLLPGYAGWAGSNIAERLYSMLRLGPLYEEVGDTAKAIEAYQRIVDQWADGDSRGQVTVQQFRDRIAALRN
jgi:eukaryotic-like serine/threonine-protein kinase